MKTTNISKTRSIVSVLAGLAVIFVASSGVDALLHATGVYPPVGEDMGDGLFALALAYRLVINIAGRALTARLATARHALVLGGIGIVLATVGAIVMWEHGHVWYPLALVASALPCAWIGSSYAGSRRSWRFPDGADRASVIAWRDRCAEPRPHMKDQRRDPRRRAGTPRDPSSIRSAPAPDGGSRAVLPADGARADGARGARAARRYTSPAQEVISVRRGAADDRRGTFLDGQLLAC